MKSAYLVFTIILAAAVSGFNAAPFTDQRYVEVTYGACINRTAISINDAVDVIINLNIKNEPKIKNSCFCLNKHSGIQDEDGNFVKYALKKRVQNFHVSKSKVKYILDVCTKKRETAAETAYQGAICIFKTVFQKRY